MAIVPDQALDEVNAAGAPMAAESLSMDLSSEDRAPAEVLNVAIWKSVRGSSSEMPQPRTSFHEPAVPQSRSDRGDDELHE
jgi:hypothetical protein